MSNYTPEAYAESARKYGITQGPWYWSDQYPTASGEPTWSLCSEAYTHGILSCDVPNSPQGCGPKQNANVLEQLPNLLIERDALKAENERLRKALETLRNLHTDAVFVCGVDDEQRAHEALMSADAALTGGGA